MRTRAAAGGLSADVPYSRLCHTTDVAVAQRGISGVRRSPVADYDFLKDLSRVAAPAS